MTTLQLTLCLLLATIIPDSLEYGNNAWATRGRRQGWGPSINLGNIGRVCPSRGEDTACTQAAVLLQQYFHVKWTKTRCRRNHGEGHRMQCHIKVKQSKTTDFECFIKNSGNDAVAKCRAPWGKDLGNTQRRTDYGGYVGMGFPVPGMSPLPKGPGMSPPMGPGMLPAMGPGMSPAMGPGMSPGMGYGVYGGQQMGMGGQPIMNYYPGG
uniref:Uncharacterized protein n=1 Tax=Cacopsylla melanoneura TaxID=428564 RepID=A0A8D8PR10_9HEMI